MGENTNAESTSAPAPPVQTSQALGLHVSVDPVVADIVMQNVAKFPSNATQAAINAGR